MEYESLVYGYIRDIRVDPYSEEGINRRLANRQVLLALPGAETGAVLYREMFGVPAEFPPAESYQSGVVHFGATYLGVEYEWEHWIARFEELLRRMYWFQSTVYLETELLGKHTFSWDTCQNYHVPDSTDMAVRCEWSREGSLV